VRTVVRVPWRAHGSRHGGWVLNEAAETYSGPHLSRVVTHRMYSSVRDPRKPRGGIPWRAHGSRHGGWVLKEAAETIPPPTLKGSHTPTPPVPLWRLHQSLHWSGRESRTDTACCTHTPGALSRRPSPHVEGRRVGARTHGVRQEGRGTHTWRAQHRAWSHGHCAQKWFKSSAFVRCRATEHTPGTGNHARDVQDKCMLAREPRPTRGDRVRST
jgi:hypothetical protein